ncbi:MAG: preprotein translocase subunit YajC [Alphaproteobacteria bacterium]|nr:preprotein translocase subunit YajC [Alphaproteobacteria bacterium]
MFISTAWAQSGGGDAGSALTAFLPLILIFVIFYFLLIRPQQKRQKQHQQKLQAIRRGDKILTGGGLFASVTKVIDDNELQAEIADGVKVRVARSMVADVISKTEPAKDQAPANDGAKKGGLLGGLLGGGKSQGGADAADKTVEGKAEGGQSGGKKGGGEK